MACTCAPWRREKGVGYATAVSPRGMRVLDSYLHMRPNASLDVSCDPRLFLPLSTISLSFSLSFLRSLRLFLFLCLSRTLSLSDSRTPLQSLHVPRALHWGSTGRGKKKVDHGFDVSSATSARMTDDYGIRVERDRQRKREGSHPPTNHPTHTPAFFTVCTHRVTRLDPSLSLSHRF